MKKITLFFLIIIGLFYINYAVAAPELKMVDFTVDNTDVGLRSFTLKAPDFNVNPAAKDENCTFYMDNVVKGTMKETGNNTGIVNILIDVSKGEHSFKVICSDPAVGTAQAGTVTWSFGTKTMVLIPSKCLQTNEIWFLGGGYTLKTDSILNDGTTNVKIILETVLYGGETLEEEVIGLGETFLYFPVGEYEEVLTTKLQAIGNAGSKKCLQFSDTYINSKKINSEVAPQMVSIWGQVSASKKTLIPGENVDLSGGFNIRATSIDADSIPNTATLVLTSNCKKLDEKTIIEGEYYSYSDILKIKVDSIFPGATSDMVQLREAALKSPYDTAFFPYKTENWSCSEWSVCHNEKQTRTCTDSNNCGTAFDKPTTTQDCAVCTENWSCTGWSACVDKKQTRECTDSNNCGTTTSKPVTTRSCICAEDWSCEEWSQCLNGKQTRTCADLNNCGTIIRKPTLTQVCGAVCNENWTCEEWSSCLNGQQTRTCTDSNNCGTGKNKPILKQDCQARQQDQSNQSRSQQTEANQQSGSSTALNIIYGASFSAVLIAIITAVLKRKFKKP